MLQTDSEWCYLKISVQGKKNEVLREGSFWLEGGEQYPVYDIQLKEIPIIVTN